MRIIIDVSHVTSVQVRQDYIFVYGTIVCLSYQFLGHTCPIDGQTFQICKPCLVTCENFGELIPCPLICEPGCGCPSGTVSIYFINTLI